MGQGIAGVFPALAGNGFVKGDAATLVKLILSGRNGMPSFRSELSDDQIAELASHIRMSWGNKATSVTAQFIADVRVQTNNLSTGRPEMSH